MTVDMIEIIKKAAFEAGIWELGELDISRLAYHGEVREICRGNLCRGYGATWACPPAIGTLDECRARVEKYSRMALFSAKYQLEDSFDMEGMQNGWREFKRTVDVLDGLLRKRLSGDYLLLSNEGCKRCEKCTYPDAPCRFPDKLFHSLEGYGFIVSDLAKMAGIRYINGENTVTYFGAVLFEPRD